MKVFPRDLGNMQDTQYFKLKQKDSENCEVAREQTCEKHISKLMNFLI